jgi:hypothetical protein
VRTVYFEGFGLVPSYSSDSGELGFAQIVYTIKNLLEEVQEAEVFLRVSHDAAPFDEVRLVSLKPLDMGQVGLSYNYMPATGWSNGNYGFSLELRLDGQPYATTAEEVLNVEGQASSSAHGSAEPPGVRSAVVAGIAVAALLILAGIGYVALVRRRRQ